jgi:2-keto-4-pentenoate hydratase/2-oxohepta-3-ene-1,7-dioic acid hydratase in catechol pathway
MKLAHVSHEGRRRWGLVDTESGTVTPVVGTIEDWGPALTLDGTEPTLDGAAIPLAEVTFLLPIVPTSTIVGVGMNYWSHLRKLGVTERPPSTIGYLKPRTAMVAHEEQITYSALTEQLDFEVELVAIIGAPEVPFGHPTDAVLGYTVGNDVSARDAAAPPLGGLDLFTIKALDRSTPLGPWITTKDELGGGPQPDLEISLRVNGEGRQLDRTSNMLFTIDECIQYVLERMSLTTGDVVFTGTTDGVGMEDGRFLQPGDLVEAEVSGIGVLRNTVGSHQPRRQ